MPDIGTIKCYSDLSHIAQSHVASLGKQSQTNTTKQCCVAQCWCTLSVDQNGLGGWQSLAILENNFRPSHGSRRCVRPSAAPAAIPVVQSQLERQPDTSTYVVQRSCACLNCDASASNIMIDCL